MLGCRVTSPKPLHLQVKKRCPVLINEEKISLAIVRRNASVKEACSRRFSQQATEWSHMQNASWSGLSLQSRTLCIGRQISANTA